MAISMVKDRDVPRNYNAQGFAQSELLPGGYDMGRFYRCFLQANSVVRPQCYSDKLTVYCFVKGTGFIVTDHRSFNIDELCFLVPGFDLQCLEIHANTDLEYLSFVIDMTEKDWAQYRKNHTKMPHFVSISTAREYEQDCSLPNTRCWSIFSTKHVVRIMLGIIKGDEEGTGNVEKGHFKVHQWNYALEGADFILNVEGEEAEHQEGDWSFVPAGLDHSLLAKPGGKVRYFWFEHFVKEFE